VEGKDNIKDLFGEKLGSFEANVRPELWANISSQIGSAASATGTTLIAKIVIGISVAASVATVGYFVFTDNDTVEKIPSKIISIPDNNSKTTLSDTKKVVGKKENSINHYLDVNLVSNYLPEVLNNSLGEVYTEENSVEEGIIAPTVINKENKDAVINKNIEQIPQINKNESEHVSPEIVETSEKVESLGVLPNVFTPNGDRINDVFSVESKGLSDFSIVVIDKNSKIIYQSIDVNFVWDGTGLNGEIITKGTYIYYITARNLKGELISKHSMLNIETDR
jgi:gliding motility-associated-like protein